MQSIVLSRKKEGFPAGTEIVDTIESAMRELLVVRNPELKALPENEREAKLSAFAKEVGDLGAVFAYYPWKRVAVRLPSEEIYFELRTARNKNIITHEEQEQYRNASVGIIGLSVGLNVISALVFSGGPKRLRISDYDVVEITNLNRLRAAVSDIGKSKIEVAARQIWDLDPFAELDLWDKGVSSATLEKFILDEPKLDVFVDEMDSLELKLRSRLLCRKQGIPVVMVTDNGDNVIIDVERFDNEPNLKILHGLVEGVDPDTIANLPYPEWVQVATRIVDPKNLTPRMQESLKEIGKTIAAVPQLGTTATIAGASAAYVIRKIITNQKIPSGRYFLKLDRLIKPNG